MHTQNMARELGRRGDEMDLQQFARNDNMIGQLGNLGQTAMGNVASAYTAQGLPGQDMAKIGAMDEDLYTRIKNDELRLFNENQMLPWENVGRMMATASGNGQLGSSVTTAQQPGPSPLLTGINTGLAALGGVGSIFGGTPDYSAYTPYLGTGLF
jgi:hypothetical protein